jgi:pSer/pThr/pTyr-binding forkhead associated (FHA) protein
MALRIMYKDIKNGDKKKVKKKPFGLEILEPGENSNLKNGGVIPLNNGATIGRKSDNMVILNDSYVSNHHAKIYIKNMEYYLEDLKSTNGTFLNSARVTKNEQLAKGDIIKIGTSEFKVIG